MSTEYFPGAHDFEVKNLNHGFIQVFNSNGAVYLTLDDAQRHSFDLLAKNIAGDAIHGSGARSGAPECYPRTRVAVRSEITEWIRQEEGPTVKRILWVSGPAGAGKTAIAGSLAESWKGPGENLLAASFFFSAVFGSSYCRSTKRFIATLVYQLIQHETLRDLKVEVLAALENNPLIFGKDVKEQLEALILSPLRKVDRTPSKKWPRAIIIDGVDECEAGLEGGQNPLTPNQQPKANVHKNVLSALYSAVTDESFPFLIIIVCRPDPAIARFFRDHRDRTKEIFLGDQYHPDSDIAHFVQAKFSEIRDRLEVSEMWPEDEADVVRTLVQNASGQFVYVATAMRYVESEEPSDHPQAKLHRILNPDAPQHEAPFAQLDALYACILRRSPRPVLAVKWLHAILELHSESEDSVTIMKAFLESEPGCMMYLLGNLSSLLGITENTFRFFHKSLLDYLNSAQRSGELHVSCGDTLAFLQYRWYQILKNRGPQNSLEDDKRSVFLRHYSGPFTTRYFLPSLPDGERYVPADIEWWISVACSELRDDNMARMHSLVHEQCQWFRGCDPHCKIWRTTLRSGRQEYKKTLLGIIFIAMTLLFSSYPQNHST